jgi:hypothetical protein
MLRSRLKGYVVVEYKWILLSKLIGLCLVGIAGYALVHTTIDFSEPANADYLSEDEKIDRIKLVVMKWMKDNSEMPEQVLSTIYDEAVKYPHTDLILAICAAESSFNPNAKSGKGAIGLMGILPSVWMDVLKGQGIVSAKRDLYLISKNIESGVYVLRRYLAKSNDLKQALFDYVGGDLNYANKVLRTMGEIYMAKMLDIPAEKGNG